jgi:hypothetical protein
MPTSPVTINVVDVAGNLALTQDAMEEYAKKNPKLVAKFNFTKAPAPELPGKLKAMQGAGRSDIDLVLTGTDFLAAGIEQGLLIKILPDHASKFPNLTGNYQPAAAKMQELAADYGIAVAFMPAGPLVEYNPAKVKQRRRRRRSCSRGARPIRTSHLRAAGELGPGARSSWACRTFSATRTPRIRQGLGQDVGVSQGLEFLHRVLPDRHRRGR